MSEPSEIEPSGEGARTFSLTLFARWPDMDFNQHMRNAAYLGASEDCRMRFLAEHGFTMDEFRARKLGPVVLEDRLFLRDSDGALVALVDSVVLWFDLAARKPAAPPDQLKAIWMSLARTPDFEWYE